MRTIDRNVDSRAGLVALAFAAALAAPAAAQEAAVKPTGGLIASLKLSNDTPIQIESDKLEVQDASNTATFTGNVSVVQGKTVMKSGKMIVFYTPSDNKAAAGAAAPAIGSSGIDRLEVSDKVYVKSDDQVATGDTGTFDMRNEILTLSGSEVVLSQGPNVLVGCKLTVQMRTGLANVDGCAKAGAPGGRVMMSISPGSQPGGQPAAATPN